jgi:outer membrane protein OmpA-like peptidoglycan-associated protein/opacity protein-like surface antigen
MKMKILKLSVILAGLIISSYSNAQQTTQKGKASTNKKAKKVSKKAGILTNLSISAGAGTSNYLGDLMKYNVHYKQTSFSFSAGIVYEMLPQFNARIDFGYQRLQGSDAKEGGAHRSRNLSFQSNNFDLSAALEFEFFNMHKYKFSPYITGGIGILFFNPSATVAGNKRFLRDLGTEGQGLFVQGYKGKYRKETYEFPAGVGLKYAATKRLMIQLEYNFRFTGTDFLDDVSKAGYVDKAVLDARNSITSQFAYRGNEVGAGPYPTNLSLPRGNPNNKDSYYTTQLKVVYAVKMKAEPAKAEVTIPTTEAPKDTDGDGIIDAFDRCPNEPGLTWLQGCPDKDADGIADIDDKCPDVVGFTRYRGCPVPDTDGDGVSDEQDKCPTEAGNLNNLGCPIPDTDGDGLKDDVDVCPYIAGTAENKGCPIPVVEGAELINTTADSMTYRIYFDFQRAELLPDAFNILRRIVNILKADNSLYVNIAGHADTLGTDAINMRLSAERANISRDYFKSYYINANRITTSFYGAKRPVNNVQQWLNRRVEITLYRK